MQVKFLNKGTTLIISIIGELDHHSADYIRQKVDGEIIKSSTRNIIFDLSKLSFMDSSGIGVIMGRYKNIQRLNGNAAIIRPNTQIDRIIEMSGMYKIMRKYQDISEAVGSFQQ